VALTDEALRARLRGRTPTARRPTPRHYATDVIRRPIVYARVEPQPAVPHPAALTSQSMRPAPVARKRFGAVWGFGVMAALVFAIGLYASVDGWLTNRRAEAMVSQLSKVSSGTASAAQSTATPSTASVPSTDKPLASTVSSYTVGPTRPRYLTIGKIGVHARILPEGLAADGSIGTPGNVYDTGWYTSSSLPGEQGAMLVDGHVSSWTTNGVFYDLKKLVAGDTVTVERGDGKTFTYKVVRTTVYDDDKVDMQAATSPVVAGQPGLNLITCTGKVKPGTSEFTQRLVVFTEQVSP
jgi:LPXTG-site transpeptidase (sortase) family protein